MAEYLKDSIVLKMGAGAGVPDRPVVKGTPSSRQDDTIPHPG